MKNKQKNKIGVSTTQMAVITLGFLTRDSIML